MNVLPVLGRFTSVLQVLGKDVICEALSTEWRRTCKVFRNGIMRGPGRDLSQKSFAMEISQLKSKVGTQSYRHASISSMNHLCIFGKKYSKLRKREIIRKTKKMAIIHIASMDRMKDIFGICGLCGVEYSVDNTVCSCAGKVSVIQKGKHITGFIVKEDKDYCTIKLMDHSTIHLKRLSYNYDNNGGGYVYNQNPHEKKLVITKYWLLCFKFTLQCQFNCQYLISRVALRNHKIVPQLSS